MPGLPADYLPITVRVQLSFVKLRPGLCPTITHVEGMKMENVIVTSGASQSAGILANPAFIGAVVAALLALIGVLAANYFTKRSKDQELFLSALNFLTGHTQKRSVGIAIITDYAERRGMRSVAALIFNAQRKHLEDKGYHIESPKRSIEKYNYDQMGRIIRDWEEHEAPPRRGWLRRRRHSALEIHLEPPPEGARVPTPEGEPASETSSA